MSTPYEGAAEASDERVAEDAEAAVPVELEHLDAFEEMILRGKTRRHITRWAKEKFGCNVKQVELLIDVIRGVWASEREPQRLAYRRDQLRQSYWYIYSRAMDRDDYSAALKSLEGLAKIDNIIGPDLTVNVGGAAITSRVRERIGELMGRVHELGTKPLPVLEAYAVDVPVEDDKPPVMKNGNGKNGHKTTNGLVPHPDNPPDEE